jgi:hypothetical protein
MTIGKQKRCKHIYIIITFHSTDPPPLFLFYYTYPIIKLLDFHLSNYRLRIFMCLTIDVGFSIVSLWMGANQSGVNKLL